MNPHEPSWPRLQRGSGLVLSLFLGLHLMNQAVAALGPGTYDPLQRVLRVFYQQPLVELVGVLGALTVHVVAGVVVMRRRGFALQTASPLLRLHRLAGRFLAIVIVGHVVATRGPSLLWGTPLGFDGVALTMLVLPLVYVPYYLVLGVSGVVHGVTGVALALPGLGLGAGLVRARGLRVVVAAAAVAVAAGVLGFAGVLVDVDADAVWRSEIAQRLIAAGLLSAPR